MHRRKFLTLVGGGLLLSSKRLLPEHHVVSSDPLQVAFDLGSLVDRYTAIEDFYVRNHYDLPRGTTTTSLRIEGEVGEPQELALGQLTHLRQRELCAVLECAGNPMATYGLVSNGVWEGWPLAEVLSLARPAASAAYLHLFSRDGYARSVPIDRAYGDAMLVTRLNRRPLGRNHGAPWRALFPGWYGMDSVKWLERIAVSANPLPPSGNAYLELRLGSSGEINRQPLPRVQVKSLIVAPVSEAVVRRGRLEVRGLAWSGQGKISGVQLSGDGGTHWRPATLDAGTRYEWTFWRCSLELSQPGVVELVCRATDEEGSTQPASRDPARIDSYVNNWYHRVRCVVV